MFYKNIDMFRRLFSMLFAFLFVIVSPSLLLAKQPEAVIISEVKLDRFYDRVEALGTLRANESVSITATITDTVTKIYFEDGQRVAKGDILVEMTNAEEHALLEEELSTLDEAKKQLNRIEQLIRQGASTEELLDQRRLGYARAQARLRQIESKLQDRVILAPFAGVVGLRTISVGALVEPGDIITTLDEDSVMKLDFSVPAVYLSTLNPGVEIEATAPAYEQRKFVGKISSLSSRIDETTRSITARAILPNPDRMLKPGMLMSVELLKNPREAMVVPEEAILPVGSTTHVLLVNRNAEPATTEKRLVQLGSRRPGEVEVVEGLAPGDFVVVHGGMKVRPGEPVRILAVDTGVETLQQLLDNKGGDTAQ